MEFLGTFFLVLTIGMCVMPPNALGSMAPVAVGCVLMAMIYAGGHISGAHYNPAVTLAAVVRGAHPANHALAYIAAQAAAASAASLLVLFLKGNPSPSPMSIDPFPALLAEFLFTFALAFVVLNVATAKATANNGYFGLAIAGTVVAGAYAVGGLSGGAFNPAVALALAVMRILKWSDLWVHMVGGIGGGAAAGVVFKMIVQERAQAI
jgi:aquaporin Z